MGREKKKEKTETDTEMETDTDTDTDRGTDVEADATDGGFLFTDLPTSFEVARYHSLHGPLSSLPTCLKATAMTDDGIVMAIEHRSKPFAAVQFHPESILTNPIHGLRIVSNAIEF